MAQGRGSQSVDRFTLNATGSRAVSFSHHQIVPHACLLQFCVKMASLRFARVPTFNATAFRPVPVPSASTSLPRPEATNASAP